MSQITRTETTYQKSQQVYIPSNWEQILKLKYRKKTIGSSATMVHLLKYVLHVCYSSRFTREDGAPISYHAAQAICKGDKNKFKQLRKILIENQIVRCDEVCSYRQKAFHYFLGSAMDDVTWTRSPESVIFTVLTPMNAMDPHSSVDPIESLNLIDSTLPVLSIDIEILDQAIARVKVKRDWTPEEADHWDHYLRHDWVTESRIVSTGRVYGTWSNIPRELRGLLLIDGQPVVEVDMKNAQPMLLVQLYEDRTAKECQNFIKVMERGLFYEYIMKDRGLTDRNEVKELTMAYLCGKRKSTPHIGEFFEKHFPDLLKKLESISKTSGHKELANRLQRYESDIIVQGICRDFPVFSMHDGVICPADIAEKVQQAMKKRIYDDCGLNAKVIIENDKRAFLTDPELPIAA